MGSFILFDEFLASTYASLSLFVVRLKFTYPHEIIYCQFVSLCVLVSLGSSQVGFDQNVDVVNIKSSINNLTGELDRSLIVGILSVAVRDIIVYCRFLLSNFFFEDSKIF